MKPVSYKRILAYLLDIIVVTMVSTLLTYFVPASQEYQDKSEEFVQLVEQYSNGEITQEEYLEKGNEISYILNRESVVTAIVTVVISIIYFVVIAYYMGGQTFGKKLMKIKVVAIDDKKLTMNNFLLRSLIVDSILMNVVSIFMLLFMSKNTYLNAYNIYSTIFGAIYIVTFAMILFRNDGRGLHDIIARTKVISLNKEIKEVEVVSDKINKKNEMIEDADIIEKQGD